MLCLHISHGIFLCQEASQSRRAIMKSLRPAKTHLVHARPVPVRYPPHDRALARRLACEAVAHGLRARLKLRPLLGPSQSPLDNWFPSSPPPPPAVDCLISLISHSGPHLPLVIHTSIALHHHSLWCFATSIPFIVPGPAVTLSGILCLLTYHSLSPATSTPPTRRRPLHSTTACSWSAATIYHLPLRLVAGRLCSTRLSSHPSQPPRLLHG